MPLILAPFDWLLDLISESPWTYAILAGVVFLDADLPVLPGETAIITGAIAASEGGLVVWLVALAGFAGGVGGDSLSCWIGRRFGERVYSHFFSSERDRERFEWARETLEQHGSWIIPAVRFVPGGRTAVTLAAGTVEVSWRTFLLADAGGVFLWAALYTALGYFGGQAFRDNTWASFAVAFGAAIVISAVGWGWYRLRAR